MTQSESVEHVAFLVDEGLIRLFAYEDVDPECAPAVFFGSVPRDMLKARSQRMHQRQGTHEWFLITDEGGGQWDSELRQSYGVLVVDVEDLREARERLMSVLARREVASQVTPSRAEFEVLVGGATGGRLKEVVPA